ncbi:uncharacterized protein G2W53_044571 [Senna tora]|uniref:Uncharacterized protein n=1 Tax=Senna tora TaxID=362788 RepID=A0A834SBX9_9FABA|nr:uncharacterized protein G2W53_044571 [Senna tora]
MAWMMAKEWKKPLKSSLLLLLVSSKF